METKRFGLSWVIATTALFISSLILVGCQTTAYERGEIAGYSALIAFDDEGDTAKLAQTRQDLIAFLDSGEGLTDALINVYASKLIERYGTQRGVVITAVLRKLARERELEPDGKRAREFIRGVADALSLTVILE